MWRGQGRGTISTGCGLRLMVDLTLQPKGSFLDLSDAAEARRENLRGWLNGITPTTLSLLAFPQAVTIYRRTKRRGFQPEKWGSSSASREGCWLGPLLKLAM